MDMPSDKRDPAPTAARQVAPLRKQGNRHRLASINGSLPRAPARFAERLEGHWPPTHGRDPIAGSQALEAYAPAAMQGLRILVTEDNLLEADWLQRLLLDSGYDVIGPASRLSEALYLAQREEIDGALLDINLGGLNCFAVGWCLQDRHVPFAFMTGYPRSYLPGAGGLQSVPVIAKPLREDEVLRTVAAFAA
jgi:CheY-like chemotaxis protein